MENKILKRWTENGVECVIVSVRGSHMCAYVGVSVSHPISGLHYNDMPLSCHGGLTFSGNFEEHVPELGGFYFYGWDYAHYGDYINYSSGFDSREKKWTLEEVEQETKDVAYEFKKLVELAECIISKK